MRCQQCGYDNQENHKFCGMCGATLQTAASAVTIDDKDPLGLDTSAAENRSQQSAQLARRDRQREAVRDVRTINSGDLRSTKISSLDIEDFPPDTLKEEAAEEVQRSRRTQPPDRATGISGPSFLGLGADASDRGFVYDTPEDDGFVYDTPGETPEYLLTEVSRGVSWRAWGLFLLLLVGAGLGYIQWRASRHEGPDIASILALNGATVGPGGPAMTGNNAKPAAPKPSTPPADAGNTDGSQTSASSSQSDAAKNDGNSAKSADASSSQKEPDSASSSDASQSAAKSKTAEGKAAAKSRDAEEEDTENTSDNAKAAVGEDTDKSAEASSKPESDGTALKATKPRAQQASIKEETPAQTKPLGTKDPLLIQADKYIYGRGVRQNCSTGVNLVRQSVSEGNPEANVKLGALYWAGTCVTQSKVTAYEWFSRAHSLEPRNRWIERSRNSLWASMSPTERQRIGY
jgi:hypothetical protein